MRADTLEVASFALAVVASGALLIQIVALPISGRSAGLGPIGCSLLAFTAATSVQCGLLAARLHRVDEFRIEVREIGRLVYKARLEAAESIGHEPATLREADLAFVRSNGELLIKWAGDVAWSGDNFYDYRGRDISVNGRYGADASTALCGTNLCVIASAATPIGKDIWILGTSRSPSGAAVASVNYLLWSLRTFVVAAIVMALAYAAVHRLRSSSPAIS